MIKKVSNVDLVPDDLKELLITDTGEFVAIGSNIYELQPFPAKEYLQLLDFMGEYFSSYNKIFENLNQNNLHSLEFFGKLAKSITDNDMLNKLFLLFPDIQEDLSKITFEQLRYMLGMIYKLNFVVKKNQIKNIENRAAVNNMMKMLGMNNLQQD